MGLDVAGALVSAHRLGGDLALGPEARQPADPRRAPAAATPPPPTAPLGDVKTVPLYRESYVLLTGAAGPYGQSREIGWRDLGDLPLCLMTPEMQNRRIIDQMLRDGGIKPEAALETNSVIALVAHVATGRWSSIVPAGLSDVVGLPAGVRAVPITNPQVTHLIGLVVQQRFAMSPLTNALVREAERLAERLAVR